MVVDPVMAMWRVIQTPIAIIPDNNRIIVIAVMAANPITRCVIPVIIIAPDRLIHDIGSVIAIIVTPRAVAAMIIVIT